MRRVLFLVRKELQELVHNTRLLPVLIIPPVVQLIVLGYAANLDTKNVPLVVADGDQTTLSRELVTRFEGSPYFTVVGTVTSAAEATPDLERGTARLALVIPSGYGRDVASGRPTMVQVLADGSDGSSTTVAIGYATNLVSDYAQELMARAAPAAVAGVGTIEPRLRVWFNSQLESRFFMVPGVLALLLLVVTANLSSMAIVRERELGTLEQLNVTPLRRWEIIAGKLLPFGLIGMIDAVLVLAVAVYWFEVPLRGSVLLLLALTLLYLVCTLSLGLFVSTISLSQQQAMMTTVFFFLLPMIYLSGFVFPIENMPEAIQPFTYLIPLRYFLTIVRGIFLKGVGIEVLWPSGLGLLVWGGTVLGLAITRLSKRTA